MTKPIDEPTNLALDLDAEERRPADVKEPFKVKVAGRVITFIDPEELDWQDLLDINKPTDWLHYSLSREDRQHLYEQRLPGWKLNKLIEAFMAWYNIEARAEEIQRQQRRLQAVR